MNDRNALLPSLRNDASVQPPYSVSQITETAMHRELLSIYENAGPETRPYYDLAHDTDPVAQENWVCRWVLWHVFRNRDQRKKSRSRASNAIMAVDHVTSNLGDVPESVCVEAKTRE